MSIYDREIICLSWTRKSKNGEENKMKEAENEVGYKLKMFFQEYFSMQNVEKNFEENAEQNIMLMSKV